MATPLSRAASSATRTLVPRLGFIGLGNMGLQMAQNLFLKSIAVNDLSASSSPVPRADRQFVVCDPNPDNVLALVDFVSTNVKGGEVLVVDTPLEVARRCNTVFTMLPSSPQVQAVYQGNDGILSALSSSSSLPPLPDSPFSSSVEHEPKIFIDSTTLDLHVAQNVSSQVFQAGAEMVDAPVSGGVVGAKAGTLSFMVGGPDPSFERAAPFLGRMGARIVHCGTSGNGLIAKLCNNHILGINQVAIAEGMLLGTSLGLKPDLLASIINSSTGRSWPSEVNNPVPGALGSEKSPPCERDYVGGFASKLMLKDMLLASRAAQSLGVQIPIGDKTVDLYKEMIDADPSTHTAHADGEKPKPGRGDRDFSVVYDYLKSRSGSSPA